MKKNLLSTILILFSLSTNAWASSSTVEIRHVRKLGIFDCDFTEPESTYLVVNFIWKYDSEDFSAKEYRAILSNNSSEVHDLKVSIPSPLVRVNGSTISLGQLRNGSLSGQFGLTAKEVCNTLGDRISLQSFRRNYDFSIQRQF